MEEAIERKLRRELSSIEPMTEARVVYILAEIRKLIERTNQKQQYFALDFHCAWALHAMMDRAGAERILRRFDKAFELLKEKSLYELSKDFADELKVTAELENFRTSLGAFLTAYSLPAKVIQDDWTAFIYQYDAVIEGQKSRESNAVTTAVSRGNRMTNSIRPLCRQRLLRGPRTLINCLSSGSERVDQSSMAVI